jgi:hypothetical protein
MIVSSTHETTSDEATVRVVPRRTRVDPTHAAVAEVSLPAADSRADVGNSDAEPATALDPVAAGHAMLEVIEEPSAELVAAVSGENLESRREQLQLQVAQLAGHLRDRLREVDRREAQLNARGAQLEADLRASRLWLRERETEFQQRENGLQRQIEELQERPAPRPLDVEAEPFDAPALQQELAEREHQLALRETELRERRFEIDRQAAAMRHAQQLCEQQRSHQERELAHERDQVAREFQELTAERDQQLRAAETLLAEHARQLEQDRTALLADRQTWEEQKSRQRRANEERQQASEAELADHRQRLEARQDWIERQKAGLEQVRGEILALHRQSLEMRLLAEQLWSQITGRLAPAEITQTISQLRLKLAEQYRLEEQNLQGRRDELVQLGERISQQHRELTQLRTGLRDWAAARQAEIESQAAALAQRELAIDHQQEQFHRAQREWQSERRHYEQQIRDLTSQLRTLPAAA